MFAKIIGLGTDKATGHTYILVHFWQDKAAQSKAPDRINDFLMQLRPTGERIATNAQGWFKRKSDGKFIDPATLDPQKEPPEWERETVDRDLPAEIWANIEAYWDRAQAKSYAADNTDTRIQRDKSDPHGVLARPDVAALEGNAVVDKP